MSSHVLALPKTTSIFSRILVILSLSYFRSIGLCSASMIQSRKIGVLNRQEGRVKVEAKELSEQIRMRMDLGITEIPDELIQKAELIVHQISVWFRNKG